MERDTSTNVIKCLHVVGWQLTHFPRIFKYCRSFRLIAANDSLRDSWPTKLVDFRWTAMGTHLLAIIVQELTLFSWRKK